MTGDGWAQAVRQQLGLGRLLPLGGPEDGSWITEQAASAILSHAASEVSGIRPGTLRIRLADPEAAPEPSIPAPWPALPPGPLRIEAEFSAPARQPLPQVAQQLRQPRIAASGRRSANTTRIAVSAATSAADTRSVGLLLARISGWWWPRSICM